MEKTGIKSELRRKKLNLDLDFNLQRATMENLRVEIEKRDKILDLLVSGGEVTVMNPPENSKPGTKAFEILIKNVPFKIETVTLSPIDWDEVMSSIGNGTKIETETGENIMCVLDTQDITFNSDPSFGKKENEMFPLINKRRLSDCHCDSDSERTKNPQSNEKQARVEKMEFDILPEFPEYSIDSSFFQHHEKEPPLLKFLIRLHDNNTEKICIFEMTPSLDLWSSTSPQNFHLSLQKMMDRINSHKFSKPGLQLRIWCDVKEFDIFSPSVQPFFQQFGEFVTHFTFGHQHQRRHGPQKSIQTSVDSNLLIGFILQNFPSLQFLSLDSELLKNLSDLNLNLLPPSLKPWKLPHLKNLRMIQSKNNIEKISAVFLANLLKRTPQLVTLDGIPLHCIKETVDLDKISMEESIVKDPLNRMSKLSIRSCFMLRDIYYNDPQKFFTDLFHLNYFDSGTGSGSATGRMIVALEEFSAQRYFIKEDAVRSRCSQLISRILQLNRLSLQTLVLEPNNNQNTKLKIPRLENLKCLRFELGRAVAPSFFPCGFQVNYAFPKLEKVIIHATGRLVSPEFLCCGETFENVKSLTLSRIIPPVGTGTETGCLIKIRSMFPNLTKLQLNNNLHEISRFLQSVFQHFSQLHQLILEIDADSRHGNLDAALTGIKADLCKHLEKFVPCPIENKEKEKMLQMIRLGPSLSDLKHLQLLKFVIRPTSARSFSKIPVLTPVSFEYGFGADQLKNVKVLLDFHGKTTCDAKKEILNALQPILSYVTLL